MFRALHYLGLADKLVIMEADELHLHLYSILPEPNIKHMFFVAEQMMSSIIARDDILFLLPAGVNCVMWRTAYSSQR